VHDLFAADSCRDLRRPVRAQVERLGASYVIPSAGRPPDHRDVEYVTEVRFDLLIPTKRERTFTRGVFPWFTDCDVSRRSTELVRRTVGETMIPHDGAAEVQSLESFAKGRCL